MKLRNKLTGEIINNNGISFAEGNYKTYNSIAELNEEWEDAPEEPKEYWYIDYDGGILCGETDNSSAEKMMISMGNHFESLEEADKAVEKLKAWKRLKGGGFEFMSCSYGHDKTTDDTGGWIRFRVNHLYDERYGCEVVKDLDLLFSQEDD